MGTVDDDDMLHLMLFYILVYSSHRCTMQYYYFCKCILFCVWSTTRWIYFSRTGSVAQNHTGRMLWALTASCPSSIWAIVRATCRLHVQSIHWSCSSRNIEHFLHNWTTFIYPKSYKIEFCMHILHSYSLLSWKVRHSSKGIPFTKRLLIM